MFGWDLYLHPYMIYASGEGSRETEDHLYKYLFPYLKETKSATMNIFRKKIFSF